jgi:hypothetical protein
MIEEEFSIIEDFEESINNVFEFFETATMDYDFMDLFMDKGYGTQMVPKAANDNHLLLREAS